MGESWRTTQRSRRHRRSARNTRVPIYTLERSQVIDVPVVDCWRFFSDPRNLQKITPPTLRFRIKSEVPARIHVGLMIRYSVTPLAGIPLTWLTEITGVEEPNYFVDEQRIGPYRVWHHEHFFTPMGAERTAVRDLVNYVLFRRSDLWERSLTPWQSGHSSEGFSITANGSSGTRAS